MLGVCMPLFTVADDFRLVSGVLMVLSVSINSFAMDKTYELVHYTVNSQIKNIKLIYTLFC